MEEVKDKIEGLEEAIAEGTEVASEIAEMANGDGPAETAESDTEIADVADGASGNDDKLAEVGDDKNAEPIITFSDGEYETVYNKDVKNELLKLTFNNSETMVKPGDPFSFFGFVVGVLAVAAGVYIAYAGHRSYFTLTMKFLLAVYAIIAIICFVKPIPVLISKLAWRLSFKRRFPLNCGASKIMKVLDGNFVFTDKKGQEDIVEADKVYKIYESENYRVVHVDDDNIFAVKKTEE